MGLSTQGITGLWHSVVDSYQQGLTWGLLTSVHQASPLGRSSVTSYDNAAASCPPRSWLVAGSRGLGTDAASSAEGDTGSVGCQPQDPAIPVGERARNARLLSRAAV